MRLKGNGSKKSLFGKDLAIALPLTSLIDAFSIIVIYLLVGTQGGGAETKVPSYLNLPTANFSKSIDEGMPILRIEKGAYFLNDERIAGSKLAEKLSEVQKNAKSEIKELMIQADQEMRYADLDPLLKAGSQAGIEQLKFAVVPSK